MDTEKKLHAEVAVYYSYLAGVPIAIFPRSPGSSIDKRCCLCMHGDEIGPVTIIEPLLITFEGLPPVPDSFKASVQRIILNPLREIDLAEMKRLNLDRELNWE